MAKYKKYEYHGCTNHPLYFVWKTMKQRCRNEKCKSFPNYGGRGIKMCDRWFDSFIAFFEDMGEKPSDAHSLERIDNDGDYVTENCRWATRREQNRNQRSNKLFTFEGKTQCMTDWAVELGVNMQTLRRRIKRGLPLSGILTAKDGREKTLKFEGKSYAWCALAAHLGISRSTLAYYLNKKGWAVEALAEHVKNKETTFGQ